ncbi:MAG: VanZ family protein [Lamprobacter sp.]|uniref:VanZ family protein n=1 Tax=Lamprobacter sp. TaxID=3100796 RepID=UPI002B263FE1|nr:VanZ family protein [Lamprobacter sp.]MEA3639834.1 VanZ family protein [Lamprobacter sp.]
MRTNQTSHRGIIAIVLALIAYGSLYPLSISLEAGNAQTWARFFTAWGGQDSLGDLVGNIALFVPLGFFAAIGVAPQTRRTPRLVGILFWCVLFAFVLQALQIYIPARDAALIDVVWNAVGLGIGFALASAAFTTRWLGRIADQPLPMATLLVAALWGAAELVPLVPSIDPQLIKDSLKPLLLEPRFSLLDSLTAAIGISVLGHALARILGERNSLPWLLLAALLVLAAKPFIVVVELDLSTLIGFGIGVVASGLLLRVDPPQRALLLLVGLVLVLTANGLEPFRLTHSTNAMGWIPFAEVLEGSMLINSRALVTNLFFYTAILWLVQQRGGSLPAASLLLALWVTLLEIAQVFLIGRTPSITEPIWVILVAATLMRLTDTAQPVDGQHGLSPRSRDEPPALSSRPVDANAPAPSTPNEARPWHRVLIQFAAIAALGAIPMWVVVRLPGVPYNLRELLHGDSHPLAAWVFVLALLWIGAGAAWMARQIHRARRPILRIPLSAFAAAMVSLLLLSLSVTQESILDIAGSTNLHWFVTNRDIWGEQARVLFLALGPDLVAIVERPVRFAALFGPLFIMLALAQAAWLQHMERQDPSRAIAARVAWLALNALPWLLLCKAIAFDWSSTDNLNELIARQGLLGINGDDYLYALIAVVAVNAVLVAQARSRRTAFIALLASLMVVPIAWWLLNQALADQVQKYGLTFSGIQFLLGPDRSDLLSEQALLARWVVVQTAAVMVFALGLRLATPLFGPVVGSEKPTPTHAQSPVRAQSQAHAETTFTARLTLQQLDFLDQVAKQLELDFQSAIRRVVDVLLNEYSEATLVERLSRPTLYQTDDPGQRLVEQTVDLREDQAQCIRALAAQADISVSRTMRRTVRLFMEDITGNA